MCNPKGIRKAPCFSVNFAVYFMWQRRLEKEFALYGGNPPATDSVPDETEEYLEEDGEAQPMAPITGIFLENCNPLN